MNIPIDGIEYTPVERLEMCKFYETRANWHYLSGACVTFVAAVLFAQSASYWWLGLSCIVLVWNLVFVVIYSAMAEDWEESLPEID